MESKEKIIASIKKKGARITKTRRAVIGFFCAAAEPKQISEIIAYLNESGGKCDRATVYREISFLEKENLIKKIFLADGAIRYETSSQRHHHHTFCVNCKKIAKLNLKTKACRGISITQTGGFKVMGHSIELFGLCPQCQK